MQRVKVLIQGFVVVVANGAKGTCTSAPIPFQKIETFYLSAPEGTYLDCEVTDFECEFSLVCEPNLEQLDLFLSFCLSVETIADVKIELDTTSCYPRKEFKTECPVLFAPPQCPDVFPILPEIHTSTPQRSKGLPIGGSQPKRHCMRVAKVYDWVTRYSEVTLNLSPNDVPFTCPCINPEIEMTIVPTSDPCVWNIYGTVTCLGEPVSGALVDFTTALSGTGAVTVTPNPAVTGLNGEFAAVLTAEPFTNGTASVTASTNVSGFMISTTAATGPIDCPCPAPDITLVITPTQDPCILDISGTVTCQGRPVSGAVVDFTSTLTGMGSITITPTPATTDEAGVYSARLTAAPCTNGTATITATTTVTGTTLSTSGSAAVFCPPTLILTPGGETTGGGATADVEDYSCAANTWLPRAPLLAPREAHAGGLLPNGNIIVSHGFTPTAFNGINTAEIYNPLANTWTPAPPAAIPRGSLGGDTLNGLFYAVGGSNGARTNITNAVEIYNPATNTWSTGTSMPTPRAELAVVALDGQLHAIGGFNGSYLTTHEVFDPATNTWTTAAPLPNPLSFIASTTYGDNIYVFGGRTPADTASATVYIYDPATNTWTTGTPMPTARWGAAACVCGGEIFVIGGYNPAIPGGYLSVVEAYNPVTDTWRTAASLPIPKALFPCISHC